ncbi:histidine--tRNA ligase [Amycolatopsis sp. NPDC059657]|uniref:histidine--tRNA ligase n=1 Tax=Amycolatopsis sp. NPDC059657 TaxID=3346899 RepID=UPI00366A6F0F
MAKAAEAPSGTRDLFADEVRRRKAAFDRLAQVFEHYGFDPLETPAFERLETFAGKLGDEAAALIFKILKRGVHEASGEADLALRYDHTVPFVRVIGTHGGKLPTPYKRYTIGPVWRADRPARGRFREFVQCDIDTAGASSILADAEILFAINEGLEALGIEDFQFQLNSRQALYGLLEAYEIPADHGGRVLGTLDKLDKASPDAVAAELADRGVSSAIAESLVADVLAADTDRVRARLDTTEQGKAGIAQVDDLLRMADDLPAGRARFNPRMVRGLDYYTGAIFEVEAPGYPGSIASGGRYDGLVAQLGGPDMPACGGSIGVERILAIQESGHQQHRGLDVALTVLGAQDEIMRLASQLRRRGLRTGIYLGSSGKLAKQLKWANEQHARWVVLYGPQEQSEGEVTVRDMESGEQIRIAIGEVAEQMSRRIEQP